jgi:AcrR family transcriptional regulator
MGTVGARASLGAENGEPRREQVLRVAAGLFARDGYAGVGLREIARQVGIRAPSLFKHFPSKRSLYNAVLQSLFRDLLEVVRVRTAAGSAFADRLDAVVTGYIDFVLAYPHFPAILFRATIDHPRMTEPFTRTQGFEVYRRLETFLRAGRRAGAFRPVSPMHFLLGLTGAIAFFHASLPMVAPFKPIDIRAAREQRRWKEQALDMARHALLRRTARGTQGRVRRLPGTGAIDGSGGRMPVLARAPQRTKQPQPMPRHRGGAAS